MEKGGNGIFLDESDKKLFVLFCLKADGSCWGPHTVNNFSYLLKSVSFLDITSFPMYLCIFSQQYLHSQVKFFWFPVKTPIFKICYYGHHEVKV